MERATSRPMINTASGTLGRWGSAARTRARWPGRRKRTRKHGLHREGDDHCCHEELVRGGVEDAPEDGARVVLARDIPIGLGTNDGRVSPSSEVPTLTPKTLAHEI